MFPLEERKRFIENFKDEPKVTVITYEVNNRFVQNRC
jgi:hypothetical protein